MFLILNTLFWFRIKITQCYIHTYILISQWSADLFAWNTFFFFSQICWNMNEILSNRPISFSFRSNASCKQDSKISINAHIYLLVFFYWDQRWANSQSLFPTILVLMMEEDPQACTWVGPSTFRKLIGQFHYVWFFFLSGIRTHWGASDYELKTITTRPRRPTACR